MKYLIISTCSIFLIGALATSLYMYPTKTYRRADIIVHHTELSPLSQERITAIAKTYSHDTDLLYHMQKHFPTLLNVHIIRSGNNKQYIEYDIDTPIAYIHEKDTETGFVLFAQGAIIPHTLVAEDIIESLPSIIIKNNESFDEFTRQEKITIATILSAIDHEIIHSHTIICINKTLLVLQDTDNTYQIWYSPATPLSFIQKAITYALHKKSLGTTYKPYIIETRIPQTIIIKNKSKGWIPS